MGWRHWCSIWLPDRVDRLARLREQQKAELEARRARERWQRIESLRRLRAKALLARMQGDLTFEGNLLVDAKTCHDLRTALAKRDRLEEETMPAPREVPDRPRSPPGLPQWKV